MKTKKLLYFMLAALMISLAALAACSSEPGGQGDAVIPDNAGSGAGAAGSEESEEAAEQEKYEFPEANFGGYTIRIISPDHWWAMPDIWVEEITGDPLEDSIYMRNQIVMDALNVEIEATLVAGPESRARRAITAGSDDFDVVFTDSAQAGSLATQGLYLNLHDVPGLNLDKWYWNQRAHQSAELLGQLYFTTSDANIITNDAVWVLYFNKVIAQDLGLENPYNLVREGKWTIDAMYIMTREATRDLTGDGRWSADDMWGISTHGLGFLALLQCQGQSLVRLNQEGEPYLITPDQRFVSAFIKAHRFMNQAEGVWLHGEGSFPGKTADLDHQTKTFMADLSLFCSEVLGHARVFREMTADFGLLPHPKYDEHQENYYTFMIDTVPAFGIPITASNPERNGIFMDAFTAVSAEQIIPAYYKISLEGKFTRDEDSIEMLDIIRDGRIFDLAVLYNWGNFYSQIITYGTGREGTNPGTVFERFGDRVNTAIQTTVDAFRMMQ
jgi:hypothetical protein